LSSICYSRMAETWCEKCEKCGVLCGGKEFTDENEFDEHPDRKIGYNEDNEWFCSACREKVMEYVIKCCDGSGCNECLSSDEEEEEDGVLPVDDVDAPNTFPYKKCSNCEERRSCGNYNNDRVWFCEDCYDGEECFNCLSFLDMGDLRDCENAECENRICRTCEGNFCSSCQDNIVFNCAKCDIGIIKGGRAHDNCLTRDGKVWWCLDCSSECGEESEEE